MRQLIYLLLARQDLHQFATSAANFEPAFYTSISHHSSYLPSDREEVVGDPAKGHQSVVLTFDFVDNLKSTFRKLLDFVCVHSKPTEWENLTLVLFLVDLRLFLGCSVIVLKLLG